MDCVAEGVEADAEQHLMAVAIFQDGMPGKLSAEILVGILHERDGPLTAQKKMRHRRGERGEFSHWMALGRRLHAAGAVCAAGQHLGLALAVDERLLRRGGDADLPEHVVLREGDVLGAAEDGPAAGAGNAASGLVVHAGDGGLKGRAALIKQSEKLLALVFIHGSPLSGCFRRQSIFPAGPNPRAAARRATRADTSRYAL